MKRIILAVALVLAIAVPSFGGGVIEINNCEEGTWVGGVVWKSDNSYADVPELEIKSHGVLSVAVPAGRYSLTHYRPVKTFDYQGVTVVVPAAILDYVDVTVEEDTTSTLNFGCE